MHICSTEPSIFSPLGRTHGIACRLRGSCATLKPGAKSLTKSKEKVKQ